MCGIAGGLGAGDLTPTVTTISVALEHRGPDDHGLWSDPEAGVALAHRRLSIVDLSPAGHQPMISADGRWVLVLNGEIYGHDDHRRALELAGERFRGHSDTEVFLALIAKDGPSGACAAVDGMFAFAAWDRAERVLHLGRDRMGEKPLYYGRVGGQFVFASELRALRRLPDVSSEPDPSAVAAYLRLGFVPSPWTILPGIRKIPAGTIVQVDEGARTTEPAAYWDLREVARLGLANPMLGDESEWITQAEHLLTYSVSRRLVADVPVGAFLSGGLDSTTIVALAQRAASRPVRSFTVAVGGADDESTAAAAVARYLGTDHTTLPLPELDPLELAEGVARTYDEPFADPSAIPTTLLCRAARDHVTVCLSGDGADELLGGYNRYRVASGPIGRMLGLPRPIRHGIGAALSAASPATWDRLAAALPGRPPAVGTKLHKMARALKADSSLGAYAALATQWDPAEVLLEPPSPGESLPTVAGASSLQAMLLCDQASTLPDDMLVKVDRASMAVALEVRVPFLDHRFVEHTWRLPDSAKIRRGQGKWLIRQILGRHVPAELWQRPKLGFDPPLASWLRGPLREWAHDLLSPARLESQGLLRPKPVQSALAAHDTGRANMDYQLWTLLMLQTWLEAGRESTCQR